MTGTFVLSVNTEDLNEPRSGRTHWDAADRRYDAQREAAHRFMRLLTGHAMAATWVVAETAILAAWGRRRSDGRDSGNQLVSAITGMATVQDIALMPSHAAAVVSGTAVHGDNAGILRCSQFAEWKENRICSLALPTDAGIDVEPYTSFGFTACCQTPLATQPSSLTDDLFQRPLPMWRTSELKLDGPILVVPISMFITSIDNHRRLVPEAVRIARIRKGLDQAAREDAVVHLSIRLSDLGRSETLFRTVEDILFDVAEARASGALRMATAAALRRLYDDEARGVAPRRAA